MLKNYFKIAMAVLKRRKFFTFISLFGISFTLTILIVLTSFYDHLTDPGYPDDKRDRSLYIQRLELSNPKNGWMRSGPVSYYFVERYVSTLKYPAKISLASMHQPTYTYINSKKVVIDMKFTNAQFWEAMNFKFLEGKPYSQQQIANAEKVAVITDDCKKDYFGDVPSVVGKYLTTENVQYRVIGVVKGGSLADLFSYGNMYVPYTLSKMDLKGPGLNGRFLLVLQARSVDDVPAMQQEYKDMIKKVPTNDAEYTNISSNADRYLASYTRQFMRSKDGSSGYTKFMTYIYVFLFVFMLLPTLNLVNINISRIMERSSEIGVRKAFGASSNTLAIQFIVENLILTFIGGLIGILLSIAIIVWFNNSGILFNASLTINLKVASISFIICLIFGLLSGVYPAWRMSRMQVIRALKAV